MKTSNIYPVILAAGPSIRRFFPVGATDIACDRNPFEIAATNCAGHRASTMRAAIFVLGCDALRLARFVPANATVVINRNWRAGQLSSLMAGLRRVPRDAAFMLYPVDLALLTHTVIARIVLGFAHRARGKEIVMPSYCGRGGHPAIFSAKLRDELRRAVTARDVVYSDLRRVSFVPVRSNSIWKDSEMKSIPGKSHS
jgi:CTP:molybdopterin cytidylyltransferase MocA